MAASISVSTSFGTFIKYLVYLHVYCIFDFFLVSVDRKVLRPGVLVGPNIVDSHIWKSFQNRLAKDYTMSCEQTFVWLSRFKKVVYVKHKTHHFYIHRMVKRRNSYIEYCYMNNRRPLLPKPKSGSVQQMNGYIVHVYLLYHHLEQFSLNSSIRLVSMKATDHDQSNANPVNL